MCTSPWRGEISSPTGGGCVRVPAATARKARSTAASASAGPIRRRSVASSTRRTHGLAEDVEQVHLRGEAAGRLRKPAAAARREGIDEDPDPGFDQAMVAFTPRGGSGSAAVAQCGESITLRRAPAALAGGETREAPRPLLWRAEVMLREHGVGAAARGRMKEIEQGVELHGPRLDERGTREAIVDSGAGLPQPLARAEEELHDPIDPARRPPQDFA